MMLLPFLRKTFLWWTFCLSLLSFYSCECGCGRDPLNFNVAAGGMDSPTIRINAQNIIRVLDRIRWLEQALHWERDIIRPHDLSALLTPHTPRIAHPFCSPNCRTCLSGNVQCGFIELTCWTQKRINGHLRLEVTDLSNTGGNGFSFWNDVCGFPEKQTHPTRHLCFRGDIGYRVELDKIDLTSQYNLLWTARLLVKEGHSKEIRLDGALQALFTKQNAPPKTFRQAIFIEDRAISYNNFQLDSRGEGHVELIAHNGLYCCNFSIQIDGDSLLKKGRCLLDGTFNTKTRLCEKNPSQPPSQSFPKIIEWDSSH